MEFFSECVRFNKPCVFKELGKDWPALSKWSESNDGHKYISEKFGDAPVGAYVDAVFKEEPKVETRKYSFATRWWQNMTHSDYVML